MEIVENYARRIVRGIENGMRVAPVALPTLARKLREGIMENRVAFGAIAGMVIISVGAHTGIVRVSNEMMGLFLGFAMVGGATIMAKEASRNRQN